MPNTASTSGSKEDHSGHNHEEEENSGRSSDNTYTPPVPGTPMFEFTPGLGEGSLAFNTKANPIVVKIGGSIRFINSSGNTVQIHCNSNGQMNHWGLGTLGYPNLAIGESRDYNVIGVAYDPQADTGPNRCYNHNGRQANNPLYIKVVP